ncbi:MAG TPA: nucleotide exchange factor GrpE [bacterium]|nr:nucleotide exchange factor GrpE [bacterium]
MNTTKARNDLMKHEHKREHHAKKTDAGELPKAREESKEGADEVRLARKEYEELQSRIKELEGVREKFLLAAADFDNAKKRLIRERDEFAKFSLENLIRHLLPVLDNFERALSHASEEKDPQSKALVSGIELVHKQLTEILKNQGLVRLESVGKTFDPHLHEAVASHEEAGQVDEILTEIEAGYMLHGKLLRAAKVRIRVAPSSGTPGEAEASGEKQEEIT